MKSAAWRVPQELSAGHDFLGCAWDEYVQGEMDARHRFRIKGGSGGKCFWNLTP